jgi:predicted RNase H-like nuclease
LLLIGLDCATDDRKVGLARGSLAANGVVVDEALVCGKEHSAAERIARWIQDSRNRALIAIDAPLGWPIELGRSLISHQAGDEIMVAPNEMFRRATDRFIQKRVGKTPLDVGADRIARTAHAALRILGELRRLLSQPIPLAWSSELSAELSAIEVYPAATLMSRGVRSFGYKKPTNVIERREIVHALSHEMIVTGSLSDVEQNADALDAAVCVLAAADFCQGYAVPPDDRQAVASEGWIWTR